jgi:putative nucleotidyltransferase with HDIG domain
LVRAPAVADIPPPLRIRRREAGLVASELALLAVTLAAAAVWTTQDDWRPIGMFLALLALAVIGQFISVKTGNVQIGPAFIATALAMALLGPLPAAVIAVTAVMAWSLRAGTAPLLVLNNIVALTVYPVVGALLFKALGDPGAEEHARLATALIVFAVCVLTNMLNFALIVGYLCVRDTTGIVEPAQALVSAFKRLYMPVFPWEVATGTLTATTVVAYQEVGVVAVGMLAVMLISYRYLLTAVVDAQRQRDELREQVEELEALHHGVVRVMVETLGMRDRMTASHSAAVARYARATAAAAGLSPREQDLIHTAGLLHDVGKFTFPDHTLTSKKLTDDDWALIRSHPERGADIVGRVHGYGEVAEIVLCHHERVDGKGYPRGLEREQIPLLARILSVADTFDVITARDSYRTPIGVEAAIAELRRVAGAQLDAEMVEVFVGALQESGMVFRHTDSEDFEAELRERTAHVPGRYAARPGATA